MILKSIEGHGYVKGRKSEASVRLLGYSLFQTYTVLTDAVTRMKGSATGSAERAYRELLNECVTQY